MSSEYPSTTLKVRNLLDSPLSKEQLLELVDHLRMIGAIEIHISRKSFGASFTERQDKKEE